MTTLAIMVLLLAVLLWIGYPLVHGQAGDDFELVEASRSLTNDQEVLMNTLGEIEFDYHMNKLSDEDYYNLKNNYASAAVEILKMQEEKQKAVIGRRRRQKVMLRTKIEQEIEEDLKK